MENERAKIGGNNPPSPVDEACAPYEALLMECENWADGVLVENKAQMDEVDRLLGLMKPARTDVVGKSKANIRTFKAAHTDAIAGWRPKLDDFDDKIAALVKTSAPFKENLAREKAEAARTAWGKANASKVEAERVEREANESSIEDQRKVRKAKEAALAADKAARVARDDKPKGLRNVAYFEIVDMRALVNFIAKNDKPAMAAFAEEYARKNHKKMVLGGDNVVKQWISEEAY